MENDVPHRPGKLYALKKQHQRKSTNGVVTQQL
jgi:hypothetical protein